jgi:LacI family transcriptional regulator
MIKILLLIDYSTEFSRKLLRGLMDYTKENGEWTFYRMPLYYKTLLGEIGIFDWAKEWKADAIIAQWEQGRFDILKNLNIPVFLQNYNEKNNITSALYFCIKCLGIRGGEDDANRKPIFSRERV